MRRARLYALPAAATLVLALALLVATARASRLDAITLAQGTLVDGNHNPIAGAAAFLYLPAPGLGQSLQISSAVTDAAGHFALTGENTPILQKLAAPNGGWLNLDLLVGNATYYLYRGVPRRFDTTAGWLGPDDVQGSTDLGTLMLAPGQPGVAKTSGKVSPPTRTTQAAARALTCTDTTVSTKTVTIPTIVGELHNLNATATFSYGHPASSTIDKAWAPGGGTWSAPYGSAAVVANPGPAPISITVSRSFSGSLLSNFTYHLAAIQNVCYGARQTLGAYQWVGVLKVGSTDDPSVRCTVSPFNVAPRQASYPASTTLTRSTNLAYRFPHAATTGPWTSPAVWLSARSGYAPSVWVRWTFSSPGVLCGDTGPPGVATRVFAG